MNLAAKFNRPIFTFVDTPGAYPGIDAEERGQAEAIARNLREMSRIPVPIFVDRHRRGRFGRRAGHWRRRPGEHPGKRHLLGDFAGRMRLDPLARLDKGGEKPPRPCVSRLTI